MGVFNGGGGWRYSISGVDARVTVSTCSMDTVIADTVIEVFQESVEGTCVGFNDDTDSCTNVYLSLYTFDAVETEKYIVLVRSYDGTEGTFTISVECDQRSLEP